MSKEPPSTAREKLRAKHGKQWVKHKEPVKHMWTLLMLQNMSLFYNMVYFVKYRFYVLCLFLKIIKKMELDIWYTLADCESIDTCLCFSQCSPLLPPSSAPQIFAGSHMLETWMAWANVRNSDFSLGHTKLYDFTALRTPSGHELLLETMSIIYIWLGTVHMHLKTPPACQGTSSCNMGSKWQS